MKFWFFVNKPIFSASVVIHSFYFIYLIGIFYSLFSNKITCKTKWYCETVRIPQLYFIIKLLNYSCCINVTVYAVSNMLSTLYGNCFTCKVIVNVMLYIYIYLFFNMCKFKGTEYKSLQISEFAIFQFPLKKIKQHQATLKLNELYIFTIHKL